MIKNITLRIIILTWFFFMIISGVTAGEYTSTFHLEIEQAGESTKADPVEAFNSAIDYGIQTAEAEGEGYLKGYSESQDSVLSESWIKKEAHLQVIDLNVLSYRFLSPAEYAKETNSKPGNYGNSLFTEVKMDITMEYLNIPKFVHDYQKTIQGATYRSMAVPGWGQIYNRQYMTSFLYGTAFWYFYLMFIKASVDAKGDNDKITTAFWNIQVPAMIFWGFNVSEAATSRYLGRQGLESLRKAYRLEQLNMQYEKKTERGFKIDVIFFQMPLYKLWS